MAQDNPVQQPRPWTPGARWYLAAVLLVAVVYKPLLGNPYTMDDWSWVNSLQRRGTLETLRGLLEPSGTLFYRPLAGLAKVAVIGLFGREALASHVLAVLLLAGAMLVLARVVGRLTDDPFAGGAAGMAYGGMLGIHHDPLLWLVGVNELGAALCVLLAFDAALAGRRWRSGAFVLAGVLFKEAASFAVVVAPLLLLADRERRPPGWRGKLAPALPFLPPALLLVGVRMVAKSPLAMAPQHPYAFHLTGETPLRLGATYLQWTLEALLPGSAGARWFEPAAGWLAARPAAVAAGTALSGLALALLDRRGFFTRGREGKASPAAPWLLAAWAALGLLPVLFLTNHVYRYYLTYSIAPLLGLAFWALHALSRRALGERRARGITFLAAALLCGGAAAEARRLPGPPGGPDPLPGGHNILLQRGRIVAITRAGLGGLLPDPPPGSVFVFDPGIEIEAFRRHSGPQSWYRRGDLGVLALDQVSFGEGRMTAAIPYRELFWPGSRLPAGAGSPEDPRLLDPARTFFFATDGKRLLPLTAAEAAARRRREP